MLLPFYAAAGLSGNMSPHIRDTVAIHLTRLIEKITKPLLKTVMGKHFITALLALLLVGVQVFAQSAVSGKVTDETGEPCVGANVLIKGTTTGTMTDFDGNYSLPHVKQGAILVISSIGYTTQEVKVGSSAVINVVLQSDNRYLDEVVVVAYGTQKKKDVTGSITDVKSDIVAI